MSIHPENHFSAIAERLLDLGQWQRLSEHCAERFRVAPNDPAAHYYAGRAAACMHQIPILAAHARELLQADGNLPAGHELAWRYWLQRGRFNFALFHAQVLMRLVPDAAACYHFAAVACLGMHRIPAALRLIEEARAIDPEDAELAELQLRCEYLTAASPSDYRGLDQRCFELLRLDPARGSSHQTVGDFYLHVVADIPRAVRAYSEALQLDPTLTRCPAKLVLASQQQNWIFRTLFWHRLVIRALWLGFRRQPLVALVLVPLASVVVLPLLGLLLLSAGVLLIPSGLMEILWLPRLARSRFVQRWIRWDPVRWGWPAWLRTGLLLGATTGYWFAVGMLLGLPLSFCGQVVVLVLLGNFLGGATTHSVRRFKKVADSTVAGALAAVVVLAVASGWWLGWWPWQTAAVWGGGIFCAFLLAWAGLVGWRWLRRRRRDQPRMPQVACPPLPS